MILNIKVSTSHPELSTLLLRQTPSRSGVWKHCNFHVNTQVENCDWWFICHDSALKSDLSAVCDPDQIVFISMEPNKRQQDGFYRQFSHVVACDSELKHHSIYRANGLTWWAGINVDFSNGHRFSSAVNHDYDSLSALPPSPKKKDRVSIITSSNRHLPGHQKRLAFIEKLMKSRLSDRIDLYGGGHNPIPDKLDALLPFKYHIALENSRVSNYWTEKLADPLLGHCLTFYYGCPNIGSFFPEGSIVPIDIEDEKVLDLIEKAVENSIYDQHLGSIAAARQQVLNDYNLFELMSSIATKPASKQRVCRIRPPERFKTSLHKRAISKLRRYMTAPTL